MTNDATSAADARRATRESAWDAELRDVRDALSALTKEDRQAFARVMSGNRDQVAISDPSHARLFNALASLAVFCTSAETAEFDDIASLANPFRVSVSEAIQDDSDD